MQIKRKYLEIFIHVVIWLLAIFLPIVLFNNPEKEFTVDKILFFIIHVSLFIAVFYSNYLFFIPILLSKRKFIFYTLAVIISIGFLVFLNHIASSIILPDFATPNAHNYRFKGSLVFFSAFLIAISTSIKVTQNWYINEKQKNIIKNEKLNSELSFLKSQINPHFLFNTLNNIYSLASRKSDNTADAIIKLSHLMRYMLDEAKKETVSLQNEINYLSDYIELQKLRMPDKSKVIFNIEGDDTDKCIEPMLLIPFVENAFKHGDIFSEDAKINILLKLDNDKLNFKVENKIDKSIISEKDKGSGIGLENLQKRLELLYPKKHEFKTEIKEDIFISSLKIQF